jgi:hypothetical protein
MSRLAYKSRVAAPGSKHSFLRMLVCQSQGRIWFSLTHNLIEERVRARTGFVRVSAGPIPSAGLEEKEGSGINRKLTYFDDSVFAVCPFARAFGAD